MGEHNNALHQLNCHPSAIPYLRFAGSLSDRRSLQTYLRSRNAIWGKREKFCLTCSVPCDGAIGAIGASRTQPRLRQVSNHQPLTQKLPILLTGAL
jgi:hypothetical protein